MWTTARTAILGAALPAAIALAVFPSYAAKSMTNDGTAMRVHVLAVDADADADADGLSDAVERNLGTDPFAADSDGDGLPDGWEIWNNLNAADAADAEGDTDGDGVLNYDEFAAGSTPFEPDSDNDGFWDGVERQRGTDSLSAASHPTTRIYADANRDGGVDAVDVQLVINGALGLAVPYPANINAVGDVDALDVQEVINNSLRV